VLSVAPWFPISYPVLRLLLTGATADDVDFVFGAAGGGFGVGSGAAALVGNSDSCAADDGFAGGLLPCAVDAAPVLLAAGAGLAAGVDGLVGFAGFAAA
jgi:hypothetical protein